MTGIIWMVTIPPIKMVKLGDGLLFTHIILVYIASPLQTGPVCREVLLCHDVHGHRTQSVVTPTDWAARVRNLGSLLVTAPNHPLILNLHVGHKYRPWPIIPQKWMLRVDVWHYQSHIKTHGAGRFTVPTKLGHFLG